MTDCVAHRAKEKIGKTARKTGGVTLIEVAFVIGIIAIIVVAALAIFNTVRASQDRSTALQNVSSIRSAVATWAGDKPLDFGEAGGLQRVEQLQPWLPGRLGVDGGASGGTGTALVLAAANPWDGDYSIGASAGREGGTKHPYRFNLAITKVPRSEAEALCRQLEAGAAISSDGKRLIEVKQGDLEVADPAGTDTPCDLGQGAVDDVHSIFITYRV